MSEVIGLMTIGQPDQEIFLGRELTQRRGVSEHKAQQVDREIKRILDESLDKTRAILKEHEDLLESLAKALLERETLNADEICLLNEGKILPPLEEEKDTEEGNIGSTEAGSEETGSLIASDESIESSSTEQDIGEDSLDEGISD